MKQTQSIPHSRSALIRELENPVVGYASFLHCKYPWHTRVMMNMLDGLIWLIGCVLWLGGKPLKNALIFLIAQSTLLFGRKTRHIALVNLDLVYGDNKTEEEKLKIIKDMHYIYGRMMLDFFFDYIYWPPERMAQKVGTEGNPAISQAQELERGFVLAGCHLGHLELLQRAVSVNGHQIYVIYKGFKSPWFDRFVARKRLNYGEGLIEVPSTRHRLEKGKRIKIGADSIREEVESVWDRNLGVGFACDQYARRGNLKMPFLGVPDTPMQVGALRYAIENRIPITLQILIYDDQGDPVWISDGPIIIEEQSGGADATLRHYVGIVNAWFEKHIHAHPEQYAWGHRRFNRDYYKTMRQG